MKTFGFIILATFLSLTAYWLSGKLGHSNSTKQWASNTLIATYVVDAEVRQFDSTGTLKHRLITPSITQQHNNPLIAIEKPDVWINQKNQYWELTGLKGIYNTNNHRFSIEGDVQINQPDKALVVLTEQLDYDDKSRLISSNREVTIKSPQGKISAKGLTIHLDTETLSLKEQIKTQYLPVQRPSK
ncbi:MAG: LPS export ABC transporter periplasmic protein LptC [Cellvibrionales bacterium]|nr:LPS export ABC transporter periplasmic protein LptC [Cellvibrionales bacterium]